MSILRNRVRDSVWKLIIEKSPSILGVYKGTQRALKSTDFDQLHKGVNRKHA